MAENKPAIIKSKFPPKEDESRINNYNFYQPLLEGNHYGAFAIKAEKGFTTNYSMLRYVACNFGGLVCKVMADFLFGEEITIKADKNQGWLQEFYDANSMQTLNYETALSNTALGDVVLRLRVKDKELVLEAKDPSMYFANLQTMGKGKRPTEEMLAWIEEKVEGNSKKRRYLVKEIYTPGLVETKVYVIKENGEIGDQMDINNYNLLMGTNYQEKVETKIKRNLLVHIPNFRYATGYYGVSDFDDLYALQFALNNRITKIDNILDKHSDPILAVPPGVLDEEGNVRKEAFGMIEVAEEGKAPEYIVWNASLDNAFKQIDKLVEFLFMFSETSPDVLGLGKGQAESGRALKMRLLRTIAKTRRKQRYYDAGLKEVFMIAQELSQANGYTINGKKCPAPAEAVEIKWGDGVVNDPREIVETEILKLEGNLTSKSRAIAAVEGTNEEETQAIIDEINADKASFTSIMDNDNPNNKKDNNQNDK